MDSRRVLTLAALASSGREGMAACVDHSAAAARRGEDLVGLDRLTPLNSRNFGHRGACRRPAGIGDCRFRSRSRIR